MNESAITIVGAGMCGLQAARAISDARIMTHLFDKGRSVGGRMATRRIGPGRADHGAQFLTVRSQEFGAQCQRWQEEGLIFEWSRGWSDGSRCESGEGTHPRYAAKHGMNSLAKHIAGELDETAVSLHLHTRILAAYPQTSGWTVTDTDGNRFLTRALILTAPVPQSLEIIEAGGCKLAKTELDALVRLRYAPCLCGLFWVKGEVELPSPGVLKRTDHPLSWIADNLRKGISTTARIITVHAGPEVSQKRWHLPDPDVLSWLETGIRPLLSHSAHIVAGQLKRWRYALPLERHPIPYHHVQGFPPLILAGDAFASPSMEGAALSGLAAARKMVDLLHH